MRRYLTTTMMLFYGSLFFGSTACSTVAHPEMQSSNYIDICNYKAARSEGKRAYRDEAVYESCTGEFEAIIVSTIDDVKIIGDDRIIFVRQIGAGGFSSAPPGVNCLDFESAKRQYVYLNYSIDVRELEKIERLIVERNVSLAVSKRICQIRAPR